MKGLLERLSIKHGGRDDRENLESPRLSNPIRFPYGPFQFRIESPKDLPYTIEASKNLKAWSEISSGRTNTDFVDSDASNFSYRFYRVNRGGALSQNVVGYVTVTMPPGFSMLTNPLRPEDCRVANLFSIMPEGTTVSRFDPRLHELTENTFQKGKWSIPNQSLGNGEGAIVFNPGSDYKTLNFIGDVVQGSFCTPIPSGFSLRGSLIPQPGQLDTDLSFPIGEGDVVHLFDRDKQSYVLCSFQKGAWTPHPPVIGVGEAFWIAKKEARNWIGSTFGSSAAGSNHLTRNQ